MIITKYNRAVHIEEIALRQFQSDWQGSNPTSAILSSIAKQVADNLGYPSCHYCQEDISVGNKLHYASRKGKDKLIFVCNNCTKKIVDQWHNDYGTT